MSRGVLTSPLSERSFRLSPLATAVVFYIMGLCAYHTSQWVSLGIFLSAVIVIFVFVSGRCFQAVDIGAVIFGFLFVPIRSFFCDNLRYPSIPMTWLQPVRDKWISVFDAHHVYFGDNLPLIKAMLLGHRDQVLPQTMQVFVETGTVHLLAISGLHLALIAFVIHKISFYLVHSIKWAAVFTIVGVLLYACLVESRVSVIRASIMVVTYLMATICDRQPHVANAIAIAAFCVLCVDPAQITQAGCQLSFLTVLAIVIFYPKVKHLMGAAEGSDPEHLPDVMTDPHLSARWLLESPGQKHRIRMARWVSWWMSFLCRIKESFLLSLCICCVVFPITWFHFQQIAVSSLWNNVLAVPLMSLVLSLAFIGLLLDVVVHGLGTPLMASSGFFLSQLMFFLEWSEKVPGAFWERLPSVSWWLYIPLYIAAFVSWQRYLWKKYMRKILFTGALLGNVWIWGNLLVSLFPLSQNLDLYMLNVGQGESLVLRSSEGRVVLIDGGDRDDFFDCGNRVIRPFLQAQKIAYIDLVVLTHPHADHLGGLLSVIDTHKIGAVLMTGVVHRAKLYQDFLKKLDSHAIRVVHVEEGTQILLDEETSFQCLSPPLVRDHLDLNNHSIVWKVFHQDVSLLLTGDVECEMEERMVTHYGQRLRSTVLKIAHHGAGTSTSPAFLDMVRPEVALVSVGKNNFYGHPALSVVKSLEDRSIKVYRTDQHGTIHVRSDGEQCEIQQSLKSKHRKFNVW